MLILVFPKPFEFGKFLAAFNKVHGLQYFSVLQHGFFYALYSANTDYALWCLVIGDSDINFNRIFSHYVHTIREQYSGLEQTYLIVGTAASFDSSQSKIGDCFFVNHAIKFDRGELGDGFVFTLRRDKIVEERAHDDVIKFLKDELPKDRMMLCSNMLGTSLKIIDLFDASKHEEKGKYLFNWNETKKPLIDMETHDFFAVCNAQDVHCLGGLRIVSDDLQLPKEEQVKSRAKVDFLNCVSYVNLLATFFPDGPHTQRRSIIPLYEKYGFVLNKKLKDAGLPFDEDLFPPRVVVYANSNGPSRSAFVTNDQASRLEVVADRQSAEAAAAPQSAEAAAAPQSAEAAAVPRRARGPEGRAEDAARFTVLEEGQGLRGPRKEVGVQGYDGKSGVLPNWEPGVIKTLELEGVKFRF